MSSAGTRRRARVVLPVLATVAIVAPLTWMWLASLMPPAYSVMDMGYPDYGGVQPDLAMAGHDHHQLGHRSMSTRSITELVADPSRPADVRVDLVARQQQPTGGPSLARYTLNGTSPGPEIRAVQGQLVEVHLRNESVAAGVTLHWHGVDVPNAMDGVAGVTQDAVPVGGEFTYRFVADQAGTYWYHSHQVSHAQVAGGLVRGAGGDAEVRHRPVAGRVALAHTYGGVHTVNGKAEDLQVPATPGSAGPGPGHQHRQRADGGLVERLVPAVGRSTAATCTNHPRFPAGRSPSPPAAGPTSRSRCPPTARAVGIQLSKAIARDRWTERRQRTGTAAAWREARPADATAHRRRSASTPTQADPPLRLLDRTPTRLRTRPARDCGGRSTATSTPTCRCSSCARATSS